MMNCIIEVWLNQNFIHNKNFIIIKYPAFKFTTILFCFTLFHSHSCHSLLVQVTWLLVTHFTHSWCKWHEYLLFMSLTLGASDMSTCYSFHSLLVQVAWVLVTHVTHSWCKWHEYLLLTPLAVGFLQWDTSVRPIDLGGSWDLTISLGWVRPNRCLSDRRLTNCRRPVQFDRSDDPS